MDSKVKRVFEILVSQIKEVYTQLDTILESEGRMLDNILSCQEKTAELEKRIAKMECLVKEDDLK